MPNELFNSDDPQKQEPKPNDQPSLFHVGEGKKYSSIEDLDKAYGHANEHIGQLEKELEELKAKVQESEGKDDTVEKILAHLKQAKAPEDQQGKADEKPVEEIVEALLKQREQESVQKTNASKVREALTAKYGDKAGEVYKAKAKELGVDLDQLTAQSADAVIALFGVDAPKKQSGDYVPRSNVDTSTFQHKQDDPLRKLYEDKKISRDEYFRRQWKDLLQKTAG